MSNPEKCPKCGSGLSYPIKDGHASYECNSFMTSEGGFGQDVTCVRLASITAPILARFAEIVAQRDEAISHAQALRGDFGDDACLQAEDVLTELINTVNREVQK